MEGCGASVRRPWGIPAASRLFCRPVGKKSGLRAMGRSDAGVSGRSGRHARRLRGFPSIRACRNTSLLFLLAACRGAIDVPPSSENRIDAQHRARNQPCAMRRMFRGRRDRRQRRRFPREIRHCIRERADRIKIGEAINDMCRETGGWCSRRLTRMPWPHERRWAALTRYRGSSSPAETRFAPKGNRRLRPADPFPSEPGDQCSIHFANPPGDCCRRHGCDRLRYRQIAQMKRRGADRRDGGIAMDQRVIENSGQRRRSLSNDRRGWSRGIRRRARVRTADCWDMLLWRCI